MKIQSVQNYKYQQNLSKQNLNCNKNIAFRSYQKLVHDAFTERYNSEKEVETLFSTLFKALCEEENTHKKDSFTFIKQIYEQKGFRGLLQELWRANSTKEVSQILKASEERCEEIVSQNNKPIFIFYNLGKYGLSPSSKTATNDFRLSFNTQNQQEMVDFGLSKNGNLILGQSNRQTFIQSEFYTSTGTKKSEVVNSGGIQDRVEFNKDGSEKTLLGCIFDSLFGKNY